jgi:serine/threonine-protein kinase
LVRPRGISTTGQVDIIAPLSVGGMGEVHLARRKGALGFEKLIALKTIRPDLVMHEEMRRMFLDEARLLARLDHPAVAQVYDFVEQGGALYLSMEYVPGIPLSKLMQKRQKALPPPVVARMGVEVCRGLHAAHELADLDGRPLGVVHRDVSPQNLMLTFDGRMKILDFGVAFMFDREASTTQTGLFKGKLTYISPEQITGEGADRRSDVYSLCVVIHELLTGHRLFAKSETPMAEAIQRRNVRPPSTENIDVPKALDDAVMRGLSLRPLERFPDTRELAVALEAYLSSAGGESLEAFAERELAGERRAHQAWLQSVVEGGRSTEPVTIEETRADRPSAPSALPPLIEASEASFVPERPRRTGTLLGLTLILAAVAAGGWLLFPKALEESASAVIAWAKGEVSPIAGAIEETLEREQDRIEEDDPDAPEMAQAATTATAVASIERETPRIPPPPEPPALAPVPRSSPPPPPAKKHPPVVQHARRYGSMSVLARPGGTIWIDGKRAGRTPLERFRMTPGKHTVALRRPGDKKPRWVSTVWIDEGKHVRIRLR